MLNLNKIYITKGFGHEDQHKREDSLQKRNKNWPNFFVVNEGSPILNNVFVYDYNNPEKDFNFRGSRYDPDLREFKKLLRNDSEKI